MSVEFSLNGEMRTSATVLTVAELVEQLGYTGKRMAVERNGDIVPKGLHASTLIETGDVLEIVVAVGGG